MRRVSSRLVAWLCATFTVVSLAVADGPTHDDAALHQRWRSAVANDDTALLHALLGSHPASDLIERTVDNGKTALMVAAKAGDLVLVKRLVAGGAAIGARTGTGGTAMMFTALGDSLEVARWLRAQGASLEEVGSNGWTALTIAAARGSTPMVSWLLDAGAMPSPIDVYGFTPLMRSVANGHLATVALLLDDADGSIDQADEFGNTALHHAAHAADPNLISMLIAAGANRRLRNHAGHTAADLVAPNASLAALLAID